jgi:hypothetical protein
MPKTSENFRNPKKAVAALALAIGNGPDEVAAQAGVSVRQLFTWRQDPAFQDHVAMLRDDMTDQATGKLSALMTKAVDVLKDLLDAQDKDVRLSACRLVLQCGLKDAKLEDRIKTLERNQKLKVRRHSA